MLVDDFQVEEMIVALLGESWDHTGDRLKEIISEEIGADRTVLRVFELRGEAPSRVADGSERLSARAAQHVRRTLARPEARGNAALPFTALILRRPTRPLAHGWLTMTGLAMSSIAKSMHVTNWPKAVPLLVGPSDPQTTWTHLCESDAIAMWASGTRLWLFRCLERFPSVLGIPGDGSNSPFNERRRESDHGQGCNPGRDPGDPKRRSAPDVGRSVAHDIDETNRQRRA